MKIHPSVYNFNILKNTPTFSSNLKKEPAAQKGWFATEEGREALKINVYALHSIKDKSKAVLSEANQRDLAILNDKSYEAPTKRVKWFNPKDGRVYYLINEGKNDDGGYNIRILNDKGGFIKNAKIKPKTIMIADNFESQNKLIGKKRFKLTRAPYISHGEMVERMAYVNNPFANYVRMDLYSQLPYNGSKNIDAINLSFADIIPSYLYPRFKDRDIEEYEEIASQILLENEGSDDIKDVVSDIIYGTDLIKNTKTFSDNNIKMFVSSGNSYSNDFNFLLLAKNTQGVGSLDSSARASEFTSSRIGTMTKHYELGEYETKKTADGINYTGGEHTDFVCNLDDYFKLRGKKANKRLISTKEFQKMLNASQASPKKFSKILDDWIENEKVMSAKLACKMFNTPFSKDYEGVYVTFGDWIPYTINVNNRFEELLLPVCGTSFSTPVRTARWALNESMKDVL